MFSKKRFARTSIGFPKVPRDCKVLTRMWKPFFILVFKKSYCENKYRVPQKVPRGKDGIINSETKKNIRFQKIVLREQGAGSSESSPTPIHSETEKYKYLQNNYLREVEANMMISGYLGELYQMADTIPGNSGNLIPCKNQIVFRFFISPLRNTLAKICRRS